MFVLTCWHVYSVFCSVFFLAIKIIKIRSIRIINTITTTKKQSQLPQNPPRYFWIHPFLISITSLPSVYPLLFFSPCIHLITWHKRYLRQPVSRNNFSIRSTGNNILAQPPLIGGPTQNISIFIFHLILPIFPTIWNNYQYYILKDSTTTN